MKPLLRFYPILLCFYSVFYPVFTSNDDVKPLLDFKESLPDPNVLPDWKNGSYPCLFYGVSCNNNSRVVSIDLSSVSVSSVFDSVSTHLFSLEFITSIKMRSCNVSGTIGSVPYCSKSLLEIDVSGNSIDGEILDLNKFNVCSGLKHLNMSSNLVRTTKETVLKDTQMVVTSLESLDLSSNNLMFGGENILPWLLSGNCGLKYLSLKGNKLMGALNFKGCPNLEYLDVSQNNFSNSIPPNFGSLYPSLKHLDLSSNRFAGLLDRSLIGMNNLTHVNMSYNDFSGPFPALRSRGLRYLNLGSNHFHGSIPVLFGEQTCSSLVELNLSWNNFSGTIPGSFGSCSEMETLDISKNNFGGLLPLDVLFQMKRLKHLLLSFNGFSGALPGDLSVLEGLQTFDLSSNLLEGTIPGSLCSGGGARLRELYLQNNRLTGPIPSGLGNCSELVSLDLSMNYLTGRIPQTLGWLLNLKDLIMWMNNLEGDIPSELGYNHALENLILDYNHLTGTIPSSLRNCSNLNWISLSSNRLSGEIPSWIGMMSNLAILKLSNNSFQGPIPAELGDCKSLMWLDLNSNLLNGTIPSSLAQQSGSMAVGLVVGKKFVYLRNDGSKECHGTGNLLEFAGIRETDALMRIPTGNNCNFTTVYRGNTQPNFNHNGSMIFLDLSHNSLDGSIPSELGLMYYLMIMNLGHNNLSGSIPEKLAGCKNLGVMDLSHNRLSGQIPSSLSGLTLLTEIDLSYNDLTGSIPGSGQFETFPPYRFFGNPGLCGYPLRSCERGPTSGGLHRGGGRSRASFVGSIAMGLLFSLFCIFGLVMVAVEVRKRKKNESDVVYTDNASHSQSGQANSAWKLTSRNEALSINLATFEKPLRKLTFADLMEATNGFHEDSMIGRGGFGDVYRARLKDGPVVAVKKLIHVSGQGDREFNSEMETIGKIKHRNLVPLLGYCRVGDERLLVYEFMKHGSLEDVLHDRTGASPRLDWPARRRIAIGAARGLAFLHNCIPHIIHRDMKSSNVLIDDLLEARVSDFGMARLMSAMDTHLSVSTLAGTPGYVPPEYYQSFRCSTRGDVYSYGVVLLELLTGRRPTDSADFGDNNLVGWVRQYPKHRIADVLDRELVRGDPGLEPELLQHLQVACACLDDRPWKRPTMIQVMAMFKEIQAGSGLDSGSVAADDDLGLGFSTTVDVIDMRLKEIPEGK